MGDEVKSARSKKRRYKDLAQLTAGKWACFLSPPRSKRVCGFVFFSLCPPWPRFPFNPHAVPLRHVCTLPVQTSERASKQP